MQIPNIKNRLSILTVLAHYNIKPNKNNHIKCPFHSDDKPSCKIYPETNTFHCFGCGATGDQIEFIEKYEKCGKHEALLKAKELISGTTVPTTKNTDVMGIASKKAAKEETNFKTLFAKQKEGLPRSPKALQYLEDRGLEQLNEIGYNSGVNWNKLKKCLTFPLKDKNGNIVSLYGRRVTNDSESHTIEYGKHYYSENRKGLYPGYPNNDTEILIITEAIIDAATLLQIPKISENHTILSAYGTNGLTAEHQTTIKQLKKLQEIIFFFDGDHAGKKAIKRNTELLEAMYGQSLVVAPEMAIPEITAPEIIAPKISIIPTPENEDINSLWLNYGKEAILQLIQERKPKDEQPPIPSNETLSFEKAPVRAVPCGCPNGLDTSTQNKIIYETITARYIIKGSLPKQLDKMLVSLDVQHLETAIKYRCRLDLYEEKQSRKEAREASEKLDLRSDLIENDLSKLTDLLEDLRDSQLQQADQEDNSDIAPDLPTQSKCKAFLQNASTGSATLLQRLNELIGQSGITGEENNRLFLFVIATSHKMPDTLHALIQGSSGSGKTHLLSKIAALMPQERVVKFTRVTENSFYNYDEYFFKGKLICLEDIDGLKEEALFAWRELISNNQLSSSTSIKDENGNIRSAQRIVRGPMASICATTHGQIYEDNMSRMFVIAVDESKEQTGQIMGYQKQKAAGLIDAEKEKETGEFLQNLVRMLKPHKTVNPFANQIHLPDKAHKIRRLNELYLAFVKQITIINQYRRKRDKQGRVITETEDLLVANEIMFDSIFLKVDELDGSLRQFYEDLKEYIKTKPNPDRYEFIQREVRHALNISKSQLQRYINDLTSLEYLQQMGGHQNRGYKYKILWWDNITKLREDVKEYLKNQIDKLENNNQR